MPKRRLIVPAGRTHHYGIDPGTTRVAIAVVGQDLKAVTTSVIPKRDGGGRLAAIYAETIAACLELAQRFPAGLAWVEQPSGKHDNPSLSYATGVIQAAVYAGLGCPVETVPSATWKLQATGFGAHRKTRKEGGRFVALPFEEYGVAKWATGQMGYAGRSLDEVDAIGIAVAARNCVQLEER